MEIQDKEKDWLIERKKINKNLKCYLIYHNINIFKYNIKNIKYNNMNINKIM